MAKRKKHKSIGSAIDSAARKIQKLVRLKASDDTGYCQCVTCGKVAHFTAMQGGHFINRTRRYLVLFEENIHPQCPYCNQWGMKDTLTVIKYREWMVEYYGERRVKAMERLARRQRKWTHAELEEIEAYADKEIKYHLRRVGSG